MSTPPPAKRARMEHSPSSETRTNGSSGLPPLSLSILGVEPLDEFIKEIADFIHHMIVTRPPGLEGNIEVEAKIGLLRDRHSGQRLSLPVLVETILNPDYVSSTVLFESNMTMPQHKHFNTLLNELVSSPPSSPIVYSHRYLYDAFYSSDSDGGGRGEKVRVTRDEKADNKVLECVRKLRLGDLNVYSPKKAADWRISVNLEVKVQHPVGTATYNRRKDRLSYSHEEFVIDLTQVTANSGAEQFHELELEIARPELLLGLAMKRNDPSASELDRSGFDELIRAFVNNARILCRNAERWE